MKRTQKLVILFGIVVLAAGILAACEGVGSVGLLTMTNTGIPSYDEVRKTAASAGRSQTLNERLRGMNPFDLEAEERLTRRDSSLAGGETVDVTQYLLHEDSFAVMEDAILYCRSEIDFPGGTEGFGDPVVEYDITVSFEENNQRYETGMTVVPFGNNGKTRVKRAKNNLGRYAADRLGLGSNNIKKIKVQFVNTRKGSGFEYLFNNIFVQDIEPCYYQFDVEVQYQKTKPFIGWAKASDYDIFDKVYRSDLSSLAAAAIDVQAAIWKDARSRGFLGTPVPIVNFVRAAKFTR